MRSGVGASVLLRRGRVHFWGRLRQRAAGVVVRGADQPLCVSADELLAEIRDPDGRSDVLLARIWEDKLTKDHRELRAHQRVNAR
jgi:hypothetical protein